MEDLELNSFFLLNLMRLILVARKSSSVIVDEKLYGCKGTYFQTKWIKTGQQILK